jgi:hypothetical protein
MAARTKKKSGGFWENRPQTGGKYLTAPEKGILISKGTPLEITAVRYDEKNTYQGNPQPRYVVTFIVPEKVSGVTAGERFAGFGIGADEPTSRDNLLEDLTEYLGTPGAEQIFVKMEQEKQFVNLVKADD